VTTYQRFGRPAIILQNAAYRAWHVRMAWTVKGRRMSALADSLLGKRCIMRGSGPYRTVSRQGKRDRVTLPAECVREVRKQRRIA
jgi:hypothetical protein